MLESRFPASSQMPQKSSMRIIRGASNTVSIAAMRESAEVLQSLGTGPGGVTEEAAVAAEEEKIVANFPSAEEFAATLEKAGISPAAYHRMVRQDLTVNRMTERRFAELPEPSGVAPILT